MIILNRQPNSRYNENMQKIALTRLDADRIQVDFTGGFSRIRMALLSYTYTKQRPVQTYL